MKTRKILYAFTLIAYTLSLAHSIIPHHHHSSAEEATAHHHETHDHGRGNHHHHHTEHQHDSDEKQNPHHGDVGHFFFFTHDLNVDVLAAHSSIDNPVKSKKASIIVALTENIEGYKGSPHLTFHPPQDEVFYYNVSLHYNNLRGPPAQLS